MVERMFIAVTRKRQLVINSFMIECKLIINFMNPKRKKKKKEMQNSYKSNPVHYVIQDLKYKGSHIKHKPLFQHFF